MAKTASKQTRQALPSREKILSEVRLKSTAQLSAIDPRALVGLPAVTMEVVEQVLLERIPPEARESFSPREAQVWAARTEGRSASASAKQAGISPAEEAQLAAGMLARVRVAPSRALQISRRLGRWAPWLAWALGALTVLALVAGWGSTLLLWAPGTGHTDALITSKNSGGGSIFRHYYLDYSFTAPGDTAPRQISEEVEQAFYDAHQAGDRLPVTYLLGEKTQARVDGNLRPLLTRAGLTLVLLAVAGVLTFPYWRPKRAA